MARRAGAARGEDHVFELTDLGKFMRPPRSCVRPEWCPACRAGFDCASLFASEAAREKFYWTVRDDVVPFDGEYGSGGYGRRPWSYWKYEAPLVCGHDPVCAMPAGHDDKHEWLDAHGQLAGEERVVLQRTGPPPDAGRLDDDGG